MHPTTERYVLHKIAGSERTAEMAQVRAAIEARVQGGQQFVAAPVARPMPKSPSL